MNVRIAACAFACAGVALFLVNRAAASPTDQTTAVLQQDQRWLNALMKGDRATIASLLAPEYKHITSSGELLDRDQELATANEPAPPMKWTDQTIDFTADTAIVHGLNTITEPGKIVRERFTDVFVNKNGTWLAIAAQESTVAK